MKTYNLTVPKEINANKLSRVVEDVTGRPVVFRLKKNEKLDSLFGPGPKIYEAEINATPQQIVFIARDYFMNFREVDMFDVEQI